MTNVTITNGTAPRAAAMEAAAIGGAAVREVTKSTGQTTDERRAVVQQRFLVDKFRQYEWFLAVHKFQRANSEHQRIHDVVQLFNQPGYEEVGHGRGREER